MTKPKQNTPTDNTLDKFIDKIFSEYYGEAEAVIWEMSSNIDDDIKKRKQEIEKQKSKLKALIADREKEMLEFVIGEELSEADYIKWENKEAPVIENPEPTLPENRWIIRRAVYNMVIKSLRQRAKEWSERENT